MSEYGTIELPAFNMAMAGYYRLQVVNAKTGEVVEERPWKKNLILNGGMNQVAIQRVADMNYYGIAGTGTRANYFTSSTSTITQSGATVYLYERTGYIPDFTSSYTGYPNLVELGDVLKYANGSQSMVTAIIDGFNLTVSPTYSIDLANSQSFTLWKTSQHDLQTEQHRSVDYLVGSSSILGWNCGNQISCSTITNRRTYNFAEETVGHTYTEVGVTWTNTATPTSSFARALVDPPLTIASGFQLRMTHDLKTTYTPYNHRYVSASISGWPSTLMATESILNFPAYASYVNTGGGTEGYAYNEPSPTWNPDHGANGGGFNAFIGTDGSAPVNFTQSNASRGGANYLDDLGYSYPTYVANSFVRYKGVYFSITNAVNASLQCIGFGLFSGGGFGSPVYPWQGGRPAHVMVLDSAQEKTSLQKMYLMWKWSWARDFS